MRFLLFAVSALSLAFSTNAVVIPPVNVDPTTLVSRQTTVFTGGFATFFSQNGFAGACGTVHSDSDFISAIDLRRYGSISQPSPLCGQKIRVTNANNGKTVTVAIADACPTCPNANSMDLSIGAFQAIASLSDGQIPITWSFI